MNSYQRFFEALDQVPRISPLWDKEKKELHTEAFYRELKVMASGELAMAKFFVAVWFGDSKLYGFDMLDVAASADPEHRRLVAQWLIDPFWP